MTALSPYRDPQSIPVDVIISAMWWYSYLDLIEFANAMQMPAGGRVFAAIWAIRRRSAST